MTSQTRSAEHTTPSTHNPALATVLATGKPLADAQGEPLLPRVAQALADGATLPAPADLVGSRERSVLDAGAPYPAIDPELLAVYQARGRRLQSVAVGEGLGAALLWIGARLTALARWISGGGSGGTGSTWRSPDEVERLHDRARKGALDVPADYAGRVARFYGHSL
jgi:hypothetical protein